MVVKDSSPRQADVYSDVMEPSGGSKRARIVVCTPPDLAALETAMPSQHHRKRYRVQLDEDGVYFVALLGGSPVGHVLLRWCSTNETLVGLGISEPYVEALAVTPAARSRGVGTALMQAAEHAARERRHATIGLHVGVTNARARALYRRLGYEEMGLPPLEIRWTNRDDRGEERVESELCTYLTKRLMP